ncbi:uncharacterized protein LOC127834763 [Dreissena polymorpha]|uniref:SOCS box domain-containing protein n=1 Tax=Dreissena polymorpha TaxID=45954 RepID=A0A9D4JGJ4_DREPO|nr:uncharacterized protein LOC127834763 [Dreissena polymorpha]KAH3806842.1 hypothetical protein DPMN_135170 [Dreissena polymorpha]
METSVIRHLKSDGTVTNLKSLMASITAGDESTVNELLTKLDVRRLNKQCRVNYCRYSDITVTPLLWAVILRKHGIIESLLRKGANPDKAGSYCEISTVFTYTPLLKAVEHVDLPSIDMLLEYGANPQLGVPGPRQLEEEGGSAQWKGTDPLRLSMASGTLVFRKLLACADLFREHGEKGHVCLCYAIKCFTTYGGSSLYIQYVIQHGGTVCKGRFFRGNVECEILKSLISGSVTFDCDNSDLEMKFKSLTVHEHYVPIVQLILNTDYVHSSSCIYRTLSASILLKNMSSLVSCSNEKSKKYITWLTKHLSNPSDLKHICRIKIRNCMKRFSPEICDELPLPAELKEYLVIGYHMQIAAND